MNTEKNKKRLKRKKPYKKKQPTMLRLTTSQAPDSQRRHRVSTIGVSFPFPYTRYWVSKVLGLRIGKCMSRIQEALEGRRVLFDASQGREKVRRKDKAGNCGIMNRLGLAVPESCAT